ncbi:MAG: uroporphyrinogen-III C-methyltransferase [Burkholderiales bacterium]|nr:uroporphyrinogen-III C-methyltransferase [Burkholderiales bacterium]
MVSAQHPPASTGKVYLVGAGPGAADLLTVRAARLLASADVVLHDALVGGEILALASRAELIDVGKRCAGAACAQAFIVRQLVECARRHRVVLRLKGGDPMLFGRAQEEIDALREAGIAFEVVPGVTAALAAAAQLECPLTVRGLSRSVSFVTPRLGAGQAGSDWLRAAAGADTAAIYMAGRQLAEVAGALIAAGVPARRPAVVIANASLPQAAWRVTHLSALRDGGWGDDAGRRGAAPGGAGLPGAAPDGGDAPTLLRVGEALASPACVPGVPPAAAAGWARRAALNRAA